MKIKIAGCIYLSIALFLFGVLTGLVLAHTQFLSLESISLFSFERSLLFIVIALIVAYFIYSKNSTDEK